MALFIEVEAVNGDKFCFVGETLSTIEERAKATGIDIYRNRQLISAQDLAEYHITLNPRLVPSEQEVA